MSLTFDEQLDLISKAWRLDYGNRDQDENSGYVFFPWIRGDAESKEERIRGYHEGPAFHWPRDRQKIIDHMEAHAGDDLYWCPSMFEAPHRQIQHAMDEGALWADLDEVDPRHIDDEFKPTIAWQTSPGRFQALWIGRRPMLGASWPDGENQRLTYYLGADFGGWDTTQLLRIPGWVNHKPSYRKDGDGPRGKLLWQNGPKYSRSQFEDLPEVENAKIPIGDLLESDVEAVDRSAVWGRIRLRVPRNVRELVNARDTGGADRSATLWPVLRGLADAGCTLSEIIAIARGTVWNKFAGRNDELHRLSLEAAKAMDEREDIEPDLEPKPTSTPSLFQLIRDAKEPRWLVEGIWTEGAVGFIGGQPKSFKSWFALDMAISIATGSPFLNEFKINKPGPVLYIQEEDGPFTLKKRFGLMWEGKNSWRVGLNAQGMPELIPAEELPPDPDIGAHVMAGVVLSDPGWQEWLRDQIAQGFRGQQYRAVILDPLMMMQGDVEENKAAAMTEKLFRPLKQLAREFEVALMVVHHMRKGTKETGGMRGGQLLLGSVANHAWTEDSLYLARSHGEVKVEVESKNGPGGHFIVGGLRSRNWVPQVSDQQLGFSDDVNPLTSERRANQLKAKPPGRPKTSIKKLQATFKHLGPGAHTTGLIATTMGLSTSSLSRQLNRAQAQGVVEKIGHGRWQLTVPNGNGAT